MRLMDTKPHLSRKRKPKSTSMKVQQNAVGVVMSVHFSFNNLDDVSPSHVSGTIT